MLVLFQIGQKVVAFVGENCAWAFGKEKFFKKLKKRSIK